MVKDILAWLLGLSRKVFYLFESRLSRVLLNGRPLQPPPAAAKDTKGSSLPEGGAEHFPATPSPAPLESAVIINNELAVANSETLPFYLRGVFPQEDLFEYVHEQHGSLLVGRTFDELDRILDRLVLESSRERPSGWSDRMASAIRDHREMTARNRRAYSTADRTNPLAVFWPDPTQSKNGRSLYTDSLLNRRIPILDRSTPIVSAGSCFAMEIAASLQRHGHNYLVKEGNRGVPGSYEFLDGSEFPAASAAWGIIFNTPSFRQLVEKAFELRRLPKVLWTTQIDGKLRYLDPFRENIAFESPEAFEGNYREHLSAARAAFCEMEVFIITLGLNEVWYFKADGSVFSRSPWKTAPSLVSHRILSVDENVRELIRMTEILRAHNPKVKIIVTLSPVPLHATFRGDREHVVVANAHSKAVLRVAAEEFAERCEDVYYFPSFECVTTCTERPWKEDQRHVTPEAVERVMDLFYRTFSRDEGTPGGHQKSGGVIAS